MEAIHQLHQPTNCTVITCVFIESTARRSLGHPELEIRTALGMPCGSNHRASHATHASTMVPWPRWSLILQPRWMEFRAISATCVMLHKDRLSVFLRMMPRKTRFSAMMRTCWWMSRRHLHHYRDSDSEGTSPVSSPPRRSTRHRQPPSRYSLFFWFSNMISSDAFILPISQLQTQQAMTLQVRAYIEYLIQTY